MKNFAFILDVVGSAVSRWPRHAERANLTRSEVRRIARALLKPG